EQHDVDVLALHHRERRLAARGAEHAVVAPQDGGQRLPCSLVVVHDDDGFASGLHFRVENEVAHSSALLDTFERPPITYEPGRQPRVCMILLWCVTGTALTLALMAWSKARRT